MNYRFEHRDQVYEISLERQGEGYRALIEGQSYFLEVIDSQPGQVSLRLDNGGAGGQTFTLYWADKGGDKWVAVNGCTYCLSRPRPKQAHPVSETGEEQVRAPMPAQVRLLQVAEGERVEKGQSLLLLEAMKMEIRVKAPASGTVTRLLVTNGQAVEKEQVLAEVAPDKGE